MRLILNLRSQELINHIQVVVANRQRAQKINLRRLRQIIEALLPDFGFERAELDVHLVGVPEITRLNEQFLRHGDSTDVIAFDYADRSRADRPQPAARPGAMRTSCPTLHGEIFICVDEAVRAARRFRTSWQSEIVRYLIHGVLHLQGYDDSHPGARRKMKREEDRRLRALSRRFSLAQLARPAKLSA